ncbi:MAG: T9SS type A sorting domain-containing protein [Flavobacteriales bacterium]|nr:T9SS type A sorting domain-containing protein [Flavobacteriales bacterium]
MKTLSFFLLFMLSFTSFGQIDYGWYGLQPKDSCNFEVNCTRLTIDTFNTSNDWQIGSSNKPFFGQTLSLPNAIMTDTVNPYSSSNLSIFDLHFGAWDGSGFPYNMYIKFDHKYETDSLIDGGYITVSHDSGQSFHNVLFDSTSLSNNYPLINSDNMYTYNDTLLNGEPGFTGTSGWKTSIIQWIWMVPVKQMVSDSLIVRFNFFSDGNQTGKDGWIIDNIEIGDIYQGSSVEEIKNNLRVNLFPNRTTDYFEYTVEANQVDYLIITHVTGKQVLHVQQPESSGKINVSGLPAGNYFVQFAASGKKVVKRLVVY